MNRYTGDPNYSFGEDPKAVYLLAALSGVAFMQLPALRGYIRPTDVEKLPIIERLREEGLEGEEGMTLVIAGGLSARNIGYNIKVLGAKGKMFLAGTSVYHHPDGIKSGIDALKLAIEAAYKDIVEIEELKEYAKSLEERGLPLLRALEER
jgi:ribulose 1,5-bisphosphate carboxylase large subunit-like protein